ncbi:MAG: ABC transporter substrate-binding protein [Solirubrobacteraceae bacterium]
MRFGRYGIDGGSRRVSSLIALLMLTLGVAGCGSSASSGSSKGNAASVASTSASSPVVNGPGGTAIIRAADDWDTLNPATTTGTLLSFQMDMFLYEHLTYLNPKGEVKPQLATSWTSTPTKTVLHIRSGTKCPEGAALTPAVVAASLNYLAAPKTGAPYKSAVFGSGQGHATADEAAGTVTIALSKPWNATPLGLAMPWAGIICPKALADPSIMKQASGGSGPYELTSSQRGSQYTLTARKGYAGPEGWSTAKNGVPQTIVYKVIENNTTAANALLTGEVNVGPVRGPDYSRVASESSFFRAGAENLGATALVFNEAPGLPGSDPAVRKAISLAINRNDFMDAWTGKGSEQGKALDTMMTPNIPCYTPALGKYAPGYDPSEAKKILAEAGWRPGSNGKLEKNGKPLVIRISGWNEENAGPEYLLSALTSIGITAKLTDNSTAAWETTLYTTHKYDVSAYQYAAPFPNANVMPEQNLSLGIKDAAYYAAVEHAGAVPLSQSCPAWDAALKLEVTGLHVDPLGAATETTFAKGFKYSDRWENIDPFTLYQTR